MKKNASCKAIRTNITSPTNTFKPITKKPQLDLLSCKNQQAPSTSPLTYRDRNAKYSQDYFLDRTQEKSLL